MEKGIQPRAKMLMQFMMHVTNSRWSGCLIHKSFLHSSLGQTPMIPFPMVNLLPLEIKDPGIIQFMTGLKWFRIIVIQGCRIRSNEAKDQILSSLGKDSLSGISHLILHLQGFIVRLDECCFSLCTVWYIEQMTLEKYDIRKSTQVCVAAVNMDKYQYAGFRWSTQVCVAAVNMDKYRYAGFRWATCALMKPTMLPEKDVPPTSCRQCR
ncbi:hypothetical protein Gogos_016131 [Gossypium gossypioides]|uniref:Uncharacterized protein n=1 Tax=Gossypium gossypioides TaxID=34282 RepID=A0A7J9B6S7_GOSGO|nr:hypothetical protein [Gossypium gossypioides]